MANRRERSKRTSTARRRAATHSSGFSGTSLRLPDGVRFYEMKPGSHHVAVLPYVVKIPTEFAKAGVEHFEKTYFQWRKIGADEKSYVALAKTFGRRDPITDWVNEKATDPNFDSERLKSMYPRERQLFLLFDRENESKGIQMLDFSFHNFGKLLDSRIENSREEAGWDEFYFSDEAGMDLQLTVEEQSGGGYTFNKVSAIDFNERRVQLPESIVNHGICLDDCLVEYEYEELKRIFLCIDTPSGRESSEPEEKPKKRKKKEKSESLPSSLGDVIEDNHKRGDSTEDEEESKPVHTASDMGIGKGDDVIFRAKRHTVARISDDGTVLVLMDSKDDLVKGVDPGDCERIDTESESKKMKTKAKKSEPEEDEEPEPKKKAPPVKEVEDDEESWDNEWEEEGV